MKATRSTGRYVGFLFVLAFAVIAICSAATSKIYEVFLPIDASRSGSSVSTDVQVTEERLYIFYLVFHYKNEEQRKRLAALVGDGGRLATGEYAHPGIAQSVHLTLTTTAESASIDVDRNVQGIAAHELGANLSGAYDRKVYAGVLRPGLYHMKITILQGEREFEGFESAISVGVQPFTRMPSN
ncbi:DUF5625 family protein [Paraburkholderia caffeinitolerans]|nr:DUF5625 family protein [Paraburkholderia caffeinitolerans]